MVNVNNLTAIENVDSKPIGYLTWYTITNVEKTRDELEAHLSVRNFQEFMPRMISPSDAFRRATAECQRKNVKAASRDVNYNYLMREVYSDNTEIVRHIVIEENDKKVKSLSYDPDTAILRYDKKADRIDFQARTMMAEELCNEAVKLFHKHRVTYNERHIRDVIAEILGNMAPVPVRPSGGVYFVPERYNERLQPFICLVNDLGGSEAFKVPLINTMENKDMIRKKIFDYINDTIKNSADFLKGGKFDKCQANIKLCEIKKVVNDFNEYHMDLKLSMDDMGDTLELLRQQGRKILERVVDESKPAGE